MDLKTIFNKTPKASRAPLPWVGGLSAQYKQILSHIDGKHSVEDIMHKAGKLSTHELHKILLKLEEDGYIKRVSSHQAEPDWLNDISSYGINAHNNYNIAVEEIDAAELDFDSPDFIANTAAEIEEAAQQEQSPEAKVDDAVERRAEQVKVIRAKREAERNTQAEVAEKSRFAAVEQARQVTEAEAKAQQEVARIEREKSEAEARLQAEAEHQAKTVAEQQARAEAEQQAQAEAEEKARLEVERIEREKAEAIAREKAEAEARLQAEAEREARAEAEEQARFAAKQKAEAEEKARLEAERIAREKAEEARLEHERKAQEALAEKTRQEAERIEREKSEAIAREKAQEEARLQAEAELKAKTAAEEQARIEAERAAQFEAAEQKLREAERVAREALRAQQEAEKKAQAAAEKAARDQAKRLAKEEKAVKARLKAEKKARVRELRGPVIPNIMGARLLKPLLISIPLVLILAVGLMHVINLTMLIAPIEKLATASVGEPVKLQQVHVSLFPQLHLVLTDVSVGSNADVKIGSVHIVSAVSMLFNDVKDIQSLDIHHVTLTPADFGRQAQWIKNAAKSGKLKIAQITLKHISFMVSDLEPESFSGKVTLTPSAELDYVKLVNASGNITLLLTPQNGSAAVTLTASDWQPPLFKKLAFDEITAKGIISQNQISFSQIEAKAFGGMIKAQGELRWGGRLNTSGNFELIKMTLPRVLAAYDSGASVDGTLNAKARFTSSADQASKLAAAAEVNADFEVLTGKVDGIALSHVLVAGPASKPSADADFTRFDILNGHLQFQDGQYKYKQFTLKTEQFNAHGNFNLGPDNAVTGKVIAELRSASQRRQGSFTLSGKVADVKFN